MPVQHQLMAAVAACHATAPTPAGTDWARIVALYDRLLEIVPTPVVALNRAVAIAMAEGPAVGLELVDEIDRSADAEGYHLVPATRADLLRRLGRTDEAILAYRRTIELVPTEAERRYLTKRIRDLSQCGGPAQESFLRPQV